jgi:hypothetical protein
MTVTHVYAPTYRAVKTAAVLSNDDFPEHELVEAQYKLATLANEAYERLRSAARRGGGDTKQAAALGFADVALQLHVAHTDTGAKTAAPPEHLAQVLFKLAAAVIVDEALLEQLPMLEGESKHAALRCQSLGREYAMSLIGEILP